MSLANVACFSLFLCTCACTHTRAHAYTHSLKMTHVKTGAVRIEACLCIARGHRWRLWASERWSGAARAGGGQWQAAHPGHCTRQSKWSAGVEDILQEVSGFRTGGQSTVVRRCLTQEHDPNSNCGLAREKGKDRVLDWLKFSHYDVANPNFISNPLFFCPPSTRKS